MPRGEIDPGLGRVLAALDRLGSPQQSLKGRVLHVAGTNGKGSVCAMLFSALRQAKLRVAMFTSPHLVEPSDAFRLAEDGEDKDFPKEQLSSLQDEIVELCRPAEQAADARTLSLTTFELQVVMALTLFARQQVDVAIVEVGMGGRDDATNVLIEPAACAISSIAMDHEKFLGSTREEIAGRYFPNESSRFCGYVGDVTKCAGLSGTGMLSGGYLCGDERTPQFVVPDPEMCRREARAMAEPPWEIKAFPGRGLGVSGLRDLEKGECILSEPPAFLVQKSALPLEKDKRETFEAELREMISRLDASLQRQFWELEDCTGAAKSAIGICRTNTFTRNGDKQMLGCFLQGARFNHSCRPNVVWYWGDKADAVLKMHVTKDCKRGEELCISYLPDLESSVEQRRSRLQSSHHFLCFCEVCSEPSATKRAESESLRAEFRALDQKVKEKIKTDPEEAYRLTCRLSAIIDSEFGGDLWLHARTLNDAFNAALVSRNAALASSTMQKAITAWLRAGGDSDQELLKEMQGYADNPASHRFWCLGKCTLWRGSIGRKHSMLENMPVTWVEPAEVAAPTAEEAGEIIAEVQVLRVRGFSEELRLPLLGDYQRSNAALALAMLLELRCQQLQLRSREQVLDVSLLSDSTIAAGMAATKWAGRLEWLPLPGAGRVLLDGAHNPHAAEALGGYVDAAVRPHGRPVSWAAVLTLFASTWAFLRLPVAAPLVPRGSSLARRATESSTRRPLDAEDFRELLEQPDGANNIQSILKELLEDEGQLKEYNSTFQELAAAQEGAADSDPLAKFLSDPQAVWSWLQSNDKTQELMQIMQGSVLFDKLLKFGSEVLERRQVAELSEGSLVEISGLSAAEHLNGLTGTLSEATEEELQERCSELALAILLAIILFSTTFWFNCAGKQILGLVLRFFEFATSPSTGEGIVVFDATGKEHPGRRIIELEDGQGRIAVQPRNLIFPRHRPGDAVTLNAEFEPGTEHEGLEGRAALVSTLTDEERELGFDKYSGRVVVDVLSLLPGGPILQRILMWPEHLQRRPFQAGDGVLLRNLEADTTLNEAAGTIEEEGTEPWKYIVALEVIALSAGKDAEAILRELLRSDQDAVYAVGFSSVEGMPWVQAQAPDEILTSIRSVRPHLRRVQACLDLPAALEAVKMDSVATQIVICGSLYLVADCVRLQRQALSGLQHKAKI
ncbi:FOL3 [Symbiodinium necroappetens]|uniref:FOL3 protein n=1 Tax=Symbiodinium necroappetens TaxID=1628268 RepID=A0A812KYF0_9DINO|nr:FOL3 [Symbiodinium necroappetens]